MSRKPLISNEYNQNGEMIPVQKFQELMNAWMTRKNGYEDIELYQANGGDDWLLDGTKTDSENGIDP